MEPDEKERLRKEISFVLGQANNVDGYMEDTSYGREWQAMRVELGALADKAHRIARRQEIDLDGLLATVEQRELLKDLVASLTSHAWAALARWMMMLDPEVIGTDDFKEALLTTSLLLSQHGDEA